MAIISPVSYIPTADEFIAHWAAAETELGAGGPILLLQGVSLTGLMELRGQLEAKRAEVGKWRHDREEARSGIEAGKEALLGRLSQFKQKLRSTAPDSHWRTALPMAFSISEGYGKVIPPLEELEDLWRRYQAEAGTFTLMGLYTLGDYREELMALKLAYAALIAAEHALGLARGQRTELERKIHAVLKAYRQRIPAEFPPQSPILETLPRLSPPDHPRLPDPARATGVRNATTVQADPNPTTGTNADPAPSGIRAIAGPDDKVEDGSPVATLLPTEPRIRSAHHSRHPHHHPHPYHPPHRPQTRQQPPPPPPGSGGRKQGLNHASACNLTAYPATVPSQLNEPYIVQSGSCRSDTV